MEVGNLTALFLEESEDHRPVLFGWRLYLFICTSVIIAIMIILTQVAIFNTLKRLGSRYINEIIFPSLITISAATSVNYFAAIGKAVHYPLSDLTGNLFCHVQVFLFLWTYMYSNFLTLIITIFRYICIFHDDFFDKCYTTPRGLARFLVASNFAFSTLFTTSILYGTVENETVDVCLGNYLPKIGGLSQGGYKVCSRDNVVSKLFCTTSILANLILSSNIPEAFGLYICFKHIRIQNENVKDMIGEKHYRQRKQDNGIVIYISIVQWVIEMINFILYHVYIYFIHGISNFADKFYSLYLMAFILMIQPCFYITGDATFRRKVMEDGIWVAMIYALQPNNQI